ncbi:pyrroloquinoline quinone biosynthesis protein PqqC [Coxiella burnetii]|uniref:CBU_0637 family Dot/Icm type IV secretion system effector n=1 Tax=Coxiella burnetii TaxID=777 RepID=UPI0003A5C206|nr:CBU_0637 family Dot/Icm type IV secretion system effector [Coxiella burnetii]AML48965.1 pyrroloquinoline quinone biosynthesis protein PqqC [Coxiella burnetii]AML54914.1 pyrroloquinoline quinone biosynthesis protein PqqC [Coxiella burnetii]ATN68884.1 pyrroloquinoline quinone biosynthesis protein PqqC [Coxiella burnetii]ATN70805.1 pyrroloquinoline quinone biosynthesis protein PqqC [Coxiella burnetii]ATN72721.1 pyrroloquinoline quinone biosynthesis protein PqqC [Coxiella burnetii]
MKQKITNHFTSPTMMEPLVDTTSTADDFFEKLEKETIEIVMETPLIYQFDRLNDKQLQIFAQQFYYYGYHFPRFLGIIIWRSFDDKIRSSVASNLIDELGIISSENIDPEQSHINVFIQFAKAVGLNEADLKNSCPRDYTRETLNKIENLLVHAPFMEAMGCMSPGLENALSHYSYNIYKGLQNQHRFTEESLYHFKLHSVLDKEHGNNLKQSLLPQLKESKINRELLRKGALTAAKAQRDFFNGLQKDFSLL